MIWTARKNQKATEYCEGFPGTYIASILVPWKRNGNEWANQRNYEEEQERKQESWPATVNPEPHTLKQTLFRLGLLG